MQRGNETEEPEGSGFGRKAPGEKCETCEKRKYQDGSDENVSFKAAAHISPEAAASRVRAHEGEHVANAYTKAAEKGGKVVSASVRIKTSARISYPSDSNAKKYGETEGDSEGKNQRQVRTNPYQQSQNQIRADAVRGKNIDYVARPLEEFEMERY